MSDISITPETARRFLLRRQGLLGARRFSGALQVLESLGGVQYDPVDVCGRSPELAMHARLKAFDRMTLSETLYTRGAIFDGSDKNLCVMPMRDWPYFRFSREAFQAMRLRGEDALAPHMQKALDFVRAHGPCFSGDLPFEGRADWYWSETTLSRALLESLYFRGELVVWRREGSRRAFTLAENVVPPGLLRAPNPFETDEDRLLWQVRRRVGAVGLLWARASDAFLGIRGLTAATRALAFDRLTAQNTLARVCVDGLRDPLYCLTEDMPMLEAARRGGWRARTELIPPLDTLMWDRKLIEALFGFAYRWEIYTPAVKRVYGHYTLPVLQGTRFCARADFARDARAGVLKMRGYWPEPDARPDKTALRDCFARLAALNGMAGWEPCDGFMA